MRGPESSGDHQAGGLLMIAAGLIVIGWCARHLLRALSTGMTPGRLGAVHYLPELSYFISVGAGMLGIVFGAILVRMGWRWLFG
jgi:hypothetical protein